MHQPLVGRDAGYLLKSLREMISGEASCRGYFRDGQLTGKIFSHKLFCRSLAIEGKDRVVRAGPRLPERVLNQMRADRDCQVFQKRFRRSGLSIKEGKYDVGEIA